MALLAQITDLHIGFDLTAGPDERNSRRCRAVLERIITSPSPPDLLIASGDLTEHGDDASYARLAEMLADVTVPVLPMAGNHDNREKLLNALPIPAMAEEMGGGFIQYAVEQAGLLIVCCDSLEPGRHGGAFCQQRRDWLRSQLDATPNMPTLIFIHHPPVVCGIDWIDPNPGEAWIRRFGEAVSGHEHRIMAIHCGHIHRPLMTRFHGIPLAVTPSIAPEVVLDFHKLQPDQPDYRGMIFDGPPGYAMHYWDGTALVTHYESAGQWPVLAHFDARFAQTIRAMLAERTMAAGD